VSEHVRMWIGEAWVDAEAGTTFDATSPSTGEVIGTVPEGSRADAQRAIEAANRAAPGWAALSAFDRAAAMKRVAGAIDDRREDLANTLTLDQGKPKKAEAYDEVEELVALFDMAAADAVRAEGLLPPSIDAKKRVLLQRVPRGVVSIISRGTGRTRCRGRSSLRRSPTGTPWCGLRRPRPRSAQPGWPSASRPPTCLPGS